MKIQGMCLDGYLMVLQDGSKELERVCPECHERKPISEFGFRIMTDKKEIRLQAACTLCRGKR